MRFASVEVLEMDQSTGALSEPECRCTLRELARANALARADVHDITRNLRRGLTAPIGGGAAPLFIIRTTR